MSFWHTFTDLFLPRRCRVCDAELSPQESLLCNVCLLHIGMVEWTDLRDNPMLRILWNRCDVEAAAAGFYYRHASKTHNLFIDLKYRGCPQVGKDLARRDFPRWFDKGLGQGADMIIPVPLAWRKKLIRGYNQGEWIAQGISEVSGIPLRTDILIKKRHNQSQTRKNAQQRRENTLGVYQVSKSAENLNGKTLLLVDDIFTTGSTMAACIEVLLCHSPGARIHVYTLGFSGDH